MSWIKKKSPKPSPSPQPGLLSSGSVEKPAAGGGGGGHFLKFDEGALKNPLDWSSVPLALKEKFPHWEKATPEAKSGSKSLKAESEPPIHYSGSFKAPDYTIPYMVMDNDTINSIAIKFETTPSDIARINRKHHGSSFLIFPGDLIYVPDIENMPKAPLPPPKDSPKAPPKDPPKDTHKDSPKAPPKDLPTYGEGGGAGERVGERQLTPLNWSTEATEELADTHVSIICKFMSDDQGCIHGSLVVNHQTVMFTPHTTDPLVQELGKVRFEIIIPLSDIVYAALTKDVAPPTRKGRIKTSEERGSHDDSEGRVTSESSMELNLSLDKVEVADDDKTTPVIKLTKPSLDESDFGSEDDTGREAGEGGDSSVNVIDPSCNDDGVHFETNDAGEAGEAGDAGEVGDGCEAGDDGANSQAEVCETTPINASNEIGDSGKTLRGDSDLLSSEGAVGSRCVATDTPGCESCEHIKSNEPVFLHVHVHPKPGTTYTYTPINSSVGIDIPGKEKGTRVSRSPSVQQVKTFFCFAFAEKWADDLVQFICAHHPEPLVRENLPLRSWIEGTFEFISSGEEGSNEGLDFCEDHFDSWEIMSLKDLHKYRRRMSALEDLDLPPPTLSEESQLLEVDHLKKLVVILPASAVGHNWVLIYSTFRDGISLRTMYRNMVAFENEDSPVVLVMRDDQNKIFGSVTTCPLKMSEKFYGRGESSLYSFESPTEFLHYFWTGLNHYFVKGNSNSLSIGSGDGHPGLWIDENFYHGSSYECSTFNNKCLASSEDFICTGVEAWGFL